MKRNPAFTRRQFCATVVGSAFVGQERLAPASDRPNVCIFLTDQLRSDALGCYGNPLVRTPNLDRIAAEGARFDNAYCTTPLCSPARASIWSGVYPHRHGVVDLWGRIPSFRGPVPGWPAPDFRELPWLGHLFSNAGYETVYAGKWHCLTGAQRPGFQRALARYGDFDIDSPEQNEYIAYALSKGYPIGDIRGHGNDFVAAGEGYGTSIYSEQDHRDTFIVRRACEYLRQSHSRPFLLVVSVLSPHNPYAPPKPYDTMYSPADVKLPPNVDVHTVQRRPIPVRAHPAERKWAQDASKFELQAAWAHYLGMVTHVDRLVGELIDTLESQGLRENTMILFTSDHGDALGSHRVENKGAFMYDTVTRIPLILHMPGRIKPRVVPQAVSQVSILRTLCDYAAIHDSTPRDGASWKPLLDGRGGLANTPVFCEYNRFYGEHLPVRAIVTEQLKYVEYFGPEGELFDRQADPYEMTNLLHAPDYAGRLAEIRGRLRRHMVQGRDPCARLWQVPAAASKEAGESHLGPARHGELVGGASCLAETVGHEVDYGQVLLGCRR
ncbi:MAG: sulfatase-like hydrolase/transferase [Acidobacteria bacterium]|nr:sulfatase-like hydrolase/transferase [Acidobacteriota bacterium]